MRIITGTARGTKLKTLNGEDTRPTSERIKEAIFSAIQFELHDRTVLDLFGGTGQLALESLSRGAESAVIVDSSREACEIIKENAQKTKLMPKCRVITSDWEAYLKGCKDKFSLVFLDPPYTQKILYKVITVMEAKDVLSDNAIIVCESDNSGAPVMGMGYEQKDYKYGSTSITILRRTIC